MSKLVALDLPWDNQFPAALKAVWEGGDAACVLDQRLEPEARRRSRAVLSPTSVIFADGSEEMVDAGARVEDGSALVVATSGSSADPKAAVLSHEAIQFSARVTSETLGIDPSRHRWLACLPLNHIGGLAVVTRSIITGTPLMVSAGPRRKPLSEFEQSCSHVALVPAMLEEADLSNFDLVLLGAAAALDLLPSNAVCSYGMTETGSGVIYDGIPLEGVHYWIDPEVPSGEANLFLQSPSLASAYRDRELPSVADSKGQSWFPTGDVAVMTATGKISISGRAGSVISTGGEQLWPQDLERILAPLASIDAIMIAGRSDARFGQVVVALVVAKDV
ncbi:MAG: AMP-binding protein, partial [Actinomycetes bacterium]